MSQVKQYRTGNTHVFEIVGQADSAGGIWGEAHDLYQAVQYIRDLETRVTLVLGGAHVPCQNVSEAFHFLAGVMHAAGRLE